jgi:hypothetical protein
VGYPEGVALLLAYQCCERVQVEVHQDEHRGAKIQLEGPNVTFPAVRESEGSFYLGHCRPIPVEQAGFIVGV